jgi:deazaflavin-dependent oxidoreductase (nitroreductase family)
MGKPSLRLLDQFSLGAEELIMTRLVLKDNPGPIFKRLFKTPIFFYRIGMPLFSSFVLLITTTGRKSGKKRYTPLEYQREQGTGNPIIMAGWGGKTDWRYNLDANPHVRVQIGREEFDAIAEPMKGEEIAARLRKAMEINPKSEKIWSRWAGERVSLEDPGSIDRAAKYFPSYRLKPIKEGLKSEESA